VFAAFLELWKEIFGEDNEKQCLPYVLKSLEYNTRLLFMKHQPTFPVGLVEAINALRTKGFSISITSNTNFISGHTLRQCDAMQKMCFNFMLFSDIWKMAKPNKDFFKEIVYNTELDPVQILHVGDNKLADIQGGESMGFQTIYVQNPDETLKVINNILQQHA
jgi:FMN phosphatase YigB (HAD superfamily)